MRLKRSRITIYYHKKMTTVKDSEGCTTEEYGEAYAINGEAWPASGQAQAQEYGATLKYVYNLKLKNKYTSSTDDKGNPSYQVENGATIAENDGICLFVGKDGDPDYKVVSIKPYRFLTLVLERII